MMTMLTANLFIGFCLNVKDVQRSKKDSKVKIKERSHNMVENPVLQ